VANTENAGFDADSQQPVLQKWPKIDPIGENDPKNRGHK
jgi:hypothetical protein